jgi:hypothetical protein
MFYDSSLTLRKRKRLRRLYSFTRIEKEDELYASNPLEWAEPILFDWEPKKESLVSKFGRWFLNFEDAIFFKGGRM